MDAEVTSGSEGEGLEELKVLAARAGMELSLEELKELKPFYDLHLRHVQLLHSVDLGTEEIGLAFHPDWPAP